MEGVERHRRDGAMNGLATVFLAGDVMTGRGVDQILPCPSPPALHESCVEDARMYVDLVEESSGPIPRPVEPCPGHKPHPRYRGRLG